MWLNGDGTDTLHLPAAPFTTITVKVDGVTVTDYQPARRSGLLRRAAGWPDGLENIEVTFTHGYTEIPGDIVDAVLEQAQTQALTIAAVQQQGMGPASVTYGKEATIGVTSKWSEAVEKYKLNWGS